MLPSIPTGVPDLVEDGRIDPQLEPPADVAVKSTVRIELTFAQWRMESPPVPQSRAPMPIFESKEWQHFFY